MMRCIFVVGNRNRLRRFGQKRKAFWAGSAFSSPGWISFALQDKSCFSIFVRL